MRAVSIDGIQAVNMWLLLLGQPLCDEFKDATP